MQKINVYFLKTAQNHVHKCVELCMIRCLGAVAISVIAGWALSIIRAKILCIILASTTAAMTVLS
jgi:hypothetical protein